MLKHFLLFSILVIKKDMIYIAFQGNSPLAAFLCVRGSQIHSNHSKFKNNNCEAEEEEMEVSCSYILDEILALLMAR
jgi:hypothetical protein